MKLCITVMNAKKILKIVDVVTIKDSLETSENTIDPSHIRYYIHILYTHAASLLLKKLYNFKSVAHTYYLQF